jgi:hypothetical protein
MDGPSAPLGANNLCFNACFAWRAMRPNQAQRIGDPFVDLARLWSGRPLCQ